MGQIIEGRFRVVGEAAPRKSRTDKAIDLFSLLVAVVLFRVGWSILFPFFHRLFLGH